MWSYVPLEKVANICDGLRKPVNSKERAKRIEGKLNESLFPYYGATGQVGYIDDYLTDGEYVLLGVNCTPFVRQYDILSNKWGVLLCQKEYQTSDIRQNSKNW